MLRGVRVRGSRDCSECGAENSVELIANEDGLWSRCNTCNFVEWEWGFTDKIDYLSYLAERFNTSVDEIFKALDEVSGW